MDIIIVIHSKRATWGCSWGFEISRASIWDPLIIVRVGDVCWSNVFLRHCFKAGNLFITHYTHLFWTIVYVKTRVFLMCLYVLWPIIISYGFLCGMCVGFWNIVYQLVLECSFVGVREIRFIRTHSIKGLHSKYIYFWEDFSRLPLEPFEMRFVLIFWYWYDFCVVYS